MLKFLTIVLLLFPSICYGITARDIWLTPTDPQMFYISPVRTQVLGVIISTSGDNLASTGQIDAKCIGKKQWNCPIECQCVRFTENLMGVDFNLNAWQIKPNSKEPVAGGAVLLYNGRGHIAYVEMVTSQSIEILEMNYLGCGMISTRSLDLNNKQIRGYYK